MASLMESTFGMAVLLWRETSTVWGAGKVKLDVVGWINLAVQQLIFSGLRRKRHTLENCQFTLYIDR